MFFGLLRRNGRTKIAAMTSAVAAELLPVVAAASATREMAVVSIHDVAPATRATTEKVLSELNRHGVRVCSLLVVPNYHHQGESMKDRPFVSWLRDLESAGHEMVVHGYFHQRPRRAGETWRTQFLTRIYTNDEAEFYDLPYAEACRRITAGRDEFRAAGLTPRGFVAPGWLLNAEAEAAARAAEFEYTTTLRQVRDLRSGEAFAARALVYSVRSSWRRGVSLGWNALARRVLEKAPLLRLSIHPVDYDRAAIWRQIIDLVKRLDAARTVTTYRDWVAEQRARAGSDA